MVEDIIHWSLGRSLFLTDEGLIGIAPHIIQSGDRLCTLMGGDVPFVLKTTKDRSWGYLIGESYIHGVMDGELWEPMTHDGKLVPAHDGLRLEDVILF